jgi:hypothetical protein
MKPTKKAKRVKVTFYKTEAYSSEYYCPTCCTIFSGAGVRKNVVSFKCQCEQLLIVDNT